MAAEEVFLQPERTGDLPVSPWMTAPYPFESRSLSWSGRRNPVGKVTPYPRHKAWSRSLRSVPPSWSSCRVRSVDPEVTIPDARRASIAPEVSVQFEPWNDPPSNWEIGGMRGKPDGFL